MFSRELFDAITQGFVFRKVLPGVLIGLVAAHLDPLSNADTVTFVFSMVVFWAAIGVGHGLASLTTRTEP